MKIEAINQLTRLREQNSIKEVLEHLSKFKEKEFNLSRHYEGIKTKYNEVLQSLRKDISTGEIKFDEIAQ